MPSCRRPFHLANLFGRQMLLSAQLVLLALAGSPAHAVVGGSGGDPVSTDSPWSGVGQAEIGNGPRAGQFTGALIGPRLVLTAAHVVHGRPVSEIRFGLPLQEGRTVTIAASGVYIHPGFRGVRKGPDGFWHKDLALIELSEPAPAGVPIYPLARKKDLLKSQVTFVGYGKGGDGMEGATMPGGVRRVGYNRVDVLLGELREDGRHSAPDLLLFDFDGPDYASNRFKPDVPLNSSLGAEAEATFAVGDSGAPLFVFEDGRLRLVGVAAFVAGQDGTMGQFGSVAGATLVPAFLDWIRETVRTAPDGP